jgi:hypothetical protein
MAAPDVWVAKDDGSDIVRAAAIVGVGRDYNGNITARLSGGDIAVVTLVAESAHDAPPTPDDFHRQLLKVVAELSDTSEPAIVRAAHEDPDGWKWRIWPL